MLRIVVATGESEHLDRLQLAAPFVITIFALIASAVLVPAIGLPCISPKGGANGTWRMSSPIELLLPLL
jgi:hypothetical protein